MTVKVIRKDIIRGNGEKCDIIVMKTEGGGKEIKSKVCTHGSAQRWREGWLPPESVWLC